MSEWERERKLRCCLGSSSFFFAFLWERNFHFPLSVAFPLISIEMKFLLSIFIFIHEDSLVGSLCCGICKLSYCCATDVCDTHWKLLKWNVNHCCNIILSSISTVRGFHQFWWCFQYHRYIHGKAITSDFFFYLLPASTLPNRMKNSNIFCWFPLVTGKKSVSVSIFLRKTSQS